MLALIFFVIIGLVTMALEWGIPVTPKNTIMTALGIPALLTGAINTTIVVNSLGEAKQENEKLIQSISNQNEIPILSPGTPPPNNNHSMLNLRQDQIGWNLLGPATAYAGGKENDPLAGRYMALDFGIKAEESQYIIVFFNVSTEAEANEKVTDLKKIIPEARILKRESRFLVIERENARKKSDALLEAIRLKNLHKELRPSLMPVP